MLLAPISFINYHMKIESSLPVSYEIAIAHKILDPSNRQLLEYGGSDRRLIVIDRGICQFYLDAVEKYFATNKIETKIVIIDATEEHKDFDTLFTVLHEIETFGLLRRSEPIIAIGGGVLLDIVGMAASMYRRGVPYIRVPTTLVGLVDASVGIKTGINWEGRRNRLGGYYPPMVSYLDTDFLKTLPELEISSGLGEILKIAVIKDLRLYNLLERHALLLVKQKMIVNSDEFPDGSDGEEIIVLAVKGMLEELVNNLWETNLQRLVDFGHSFSPIIEMRSLDSNSPLAHGQAVTLDVLFSSCLSHNRGLLNGFDLARIFNTANRMKLLTSHPLFEDPLILLEALNDTIHHRNGNQNLPIPVAIGQGIFINDVTFQEIKLGVEMMKRLNKWSPS
jgi:2-epi-5-epi-valiolone synthase